MKKQKFWKCRYQLSNGDWQSWCTVESFEEAEDVVRVYAKGRPYEIIRNHLESLTGEITPVIFESLLESHGLNKSQFALHTGISRSNLTAAIKRGQFSSNMQSLIRLYFSSI